MGKVYHLGMKRTASHAKAFPKDTPFANRHTGVPPSKYHKFTAGKSRKAPKRLPCPNPQLPSKWKLIAPQYGGKGRATPEVWFSHSSCILFSIQRRWGLFQKLTEQVCAWMLREQEWTGSTTEPFAFSLGSSQGVNRYKFGQVAWPFKGAWDSSGRG